MAVRENAEGDRIWGETGHTREPPLGALDRRRQPARDFPVRTLPTRCHLTEHELRDLRVFCEVEHHPLDLVLAVPELIQDGIDGAFDDRLVERGLAREVFVEARVLDADFCGDRSKRCYSLAALCEQALANVEDSLRCDCAAALDLGRIGCCAHRISLLAPCPSPLPPFSGIDCERLAIASRRF